MIETPVSRESAKQDLIRMGLKYGDAVLVRTALKRIGFQDGMQANELINALIEVVGPEGTIVGLAFNKSKLFPWFHKNHVVNLNTDPNTGGFAKALVKWPSSLRSGHPTNSFIALGKSADAIIEGHDEYSTSFAPMEKLIKLEGKMILIGCVDTSPGFSTVHFAQEQLGLATKSILYGLTGTFFEKNKKIKLFRRRDISGCSMGFSRFYPDYIKEQKLSVGHVGNAYSILIHARDAFEIEYNILAKNPKYALCDNRACLFCRGIRLYNKADMPRFYLMEAPGFFYHKIMDRRQ